MPRLLNVFFPTSFGTFRFLLVCLLAPLDPRDPCATLRRSLTATTAPAMRVAVVAARAALRRRGFSSAAAPLSGTLYICGTGESNKLGVGDTRDRETPTLVEALQVPLRTRPPSSSAAAAAGASYAHAHA